MIRIMEMISKKEFMEKYFLFNFKFKKSLATIKIIFML